MKSIVMFIGGFALCYWLQQEYTLPYINIIEWSSEGVIFSVDGKEYDLKVGDSVNINGKDVTYTPEAKIKVTKPDGQSFTMNMG